MENQSIYEVAEVQLTYRPKVKPSNRPKVLSSLEASKIVRGGWDLDRLEFVEEFKIILLNRASRVLGIVPISSGGINYTVVDPKLVFAAALKAVASSVILVHNHPSGNLQPSNADISLTSKMKEGGKLLDINVIEHIIISREGYYSFADEGLI
ncbi:MAG: repair protein [Sphingobacteriaceae bacterium]|jgi:DNA repair protein RadC|nr:repair protein [Sphingobacteriaceae bacterium]